MTKYKITLLRAGESSPSDFIKDIDSLAEAHEELFRIAKTDFHFHQLTDSAEEKLAELENRGADGDDVDDEMNKLWNEDANYERHYGRLVLCNEERDEEFRFGDKSYYFDQKTYEIVEQK